MARTTVLEPDDRAAAPKRRARFAWWPFAKPQAERDAECCVALFLAAALPPGSPGSESVGAMLFAQGAVDAAADRAALGEAARERLERALCRAVTGSRRATASWQATLRELAQTQRGRAVRRCGEAALNAWLRGDPPAPQLAAVLYAKSYAETYAKS
jgi:hypothetical protein